MADNIAVLTTPGKLIAEGSPVALKRNLGAGYSVQVAFSSVEKPSTPQAEELLKRIATIAPDTVLSMAPHQVTYHLKSKDSAIVERVLQLLESERSNMGIASFDVHGTSIEDIFLDLMSHSNHSQESEKNSQHTSSLSPRTPVVLEMDDGRPRAPLGQALTIFHKRALIACRSWLTPLLVVGIAIAGACIPLGFMANRQQTCVKHFDVSIFSDIYLPDFNGSSPYSSNADFRVVASPPGIISTLGNTTNSVRVNNVADNATFVSTIDEWYNILALGGVSVDLETGNSLVAWEATSPGLTGPTMLNLATNILFNHALNTSGRTPTLIEPDYGFFPFPEAGTLLGLKWVALFGASMVKFFSSPGSAVVLTFSRLCSPPSFPCTLPKNAAHLFKKCNFRTDYQTLVRFSVPNLYDLLINIFLAGLWIGHLLFDSVFSVTLTTIIIIVFATASNQFHGLGLFVS